MSESDALAGFPLDAPPLGRRVVFDQLWLDLAFFHWPVDPVDVAGFLPPGTRPDTVDGATYVGLVPFRMRRAGPGRRWPVPYFGSFLEVNVRLYSVDDAGHHGVVFRTLDCNRFAVVAAARWGMNVPYVYARIDAAPLPATRQPTDQVDPRRHFRLRRRGPGPEAALNTAWRVGARVEATDLELFLTDRWGMHSHFGGRTIWVPNQHGAWPLHELHLDRLDQNLVAAAGVPTSGPMLRPLWSPGVHARFGPPRRIT